MWIWRFGECDLGCGAQGLGCEVLGSEFRVLGVPRDLSARERLDPARIQVLFEVLGFRVQNVGCRVEGAGFRI